MISVLILTKNEEQDLPQCLSSVSWCDDIHVFDSFSEDGTKDICLSRTGVSFYERKFDGYASQRNAALTQIKFRHEWVFILDADERVPKDLKDRLFDYIRHAPETVAGIRLRRRDYLYDRWLKHAAITPWYVRVVRHGRAFYEREINEVMRVDGEVCTIDAHFDHYPFSKGIDHWVEKHNRYSSMEAVRAIEELDEKMKFSILRAVFSRDISIRRFHQKGIFFRLPFRPVLKFIYMYFVRRAFLDRRAGLTYCLLQCFYEYMIVLKQREKRLKKPIDC